MWKLTSLLIVSALFSFYSSSAQEAHYKSSENFPYGRLNPSAPPELADYEELIGLSECDYINRKDGNWQDTVRMSWTFEYIMDGTAVQDIAIKDDGSHSSSVRQYIADSARWYVTYFSANNPQAGLVWEGEEREDDDIILYKPHNVPAGKGYSRLTFSSISQDGFDWTGDWVSLDGSIEFPFRKIHCRKLR